MKPCTHEAFRSLNLGSFPLNWPPRRFHASFQSTPDAAMDSNHKASHFKNIVECELVRNFTQPAMENPGSNPLHTYGRSTENSRSFFGLASKSAAAVALFTGRPSKIRVKCELTIQIKTTNKFWRGERRGEWEGERNNGHHRCSGGKSLKGAASQLVQGLKVIYQLEGAMKWR